MIVEEKKAVEYACPQSMTSADRTHTETCRGSRCMAWRWEILTKIEKEGADGLEYLVTVRSDVHGYCGLAGRL